MQLIRLFQARNLSQSDGSPLDLLRLAEAAGFGTSHGKRVEHKRLSAAGQSVRLFRKSDRFLATADFGILA